MTEICSYPYPISIDEALCLVVLQGDPVPAARARVTRFGTYTPLSYRKYKTALAEALRQAFKPMDASSFYYDLKPEDRRFGVRASFYRSTFQRTDVDNLLKSVMDAGTAILWPDDSQIGEVFGKVCRGSAQPRIEVLVYEIAPEGLSTCERCTKVFKPSSRKAKIRFCGDECRKGADTARRETGTCLYCEQAFTYPPSVAKVRPLRFCSRACNLRALGQKRRENYSPKLCVSCGKRVSRPEYERCQGCQLAQRRGGSSVYRMVKPISEEVGK